MTLPFEAINQNYVIAAARYLLEIPVKELAEISGLSIGRIYQIIREYAPEDITISHEDAITLYEEWEQVQRENNSVL